MTESHKGLAEVKVMPLRFTAHITEMVEFLTLLGFSPLITNEGKWVKLAGAGGLVALHAAEISATGARPGDTSLSLEVDDADATQAQLTAAGLGDSEIFDEAWGRVLTVRDGRGNELWIDETPDDHYGYQFDEPQPQHGILSMAVTPKSPTGPFADLLSTAGFTRLDEGDDKWWRVLRASGGGLVALHELAEQDLPGSTRLAARTREPLAALADRLRAAGHSDVMVSGDYGGELTVTDPDGHSVLVTPMLEGSDSSS